MVIEVIDVGAELEDAKNCMAVRLAELMYAPMPEKPKVYRFGRALKNQRKRERRAKRGKR